MATLATNILTLVDLAKRLDPDGRIAAIGELLSQKNQILQDIPWVQGNQTMGHTCTIRTGLPTPTWKLLNAGVQPTKSRTAQITEACAILEDWSEVNADLAKLSGDIPAFRLSEAKPHIEAISQEFAQTLFYGAASAPEEFVGLNARYSSLSANNGRNILSAGGTGSDNSSIWLIVWDEDKIHGIYPKGTQAGILHEDLGVETVEVTAGVAGTRARAYRDRWQWMCGLALRDWRFAVRVCNIDISNLAAKSSAADLFDLMIEALHTVESVEVGRPAFYMNRTCLKFLDIQGRDDVATGGGLDYQNVDGRRIVSFRGIPIRTVDALTETEAQVT